MPTLLYQPGIRVYIHSAKGGVIDVSEDLVQGTMVRRSDGVSTFDFTITNPRRVYDGIFAPNDRIVVLMKRVTWMRVFTGLLNSVPLMSIWPRDVNLRASCSLKRLQYYYWDAYAPESITLLSQLSGTREEAGKASGDHGMGHIATEVLDKVVGWPKSKVHIGQIPKGWIDIAHQIADDLATREVKLSIAGSVYDPTDPMGKLLFNVLAMVAEFEADLIRARTREGMKVAKAKGRLRGKSPKLTPRQEAHLVQLHAADEHTVGELAELFSVGRSTVYRALQRAERGRENALQ